jgi:hypothetical protein
MDLPDGYPHSELPDAAPISPLFHALSEASLGASNLAESMRSIARRWERRPNGFEAYREAPEPGMSEDERVLVEAQRAAYSKRYPYYASLMDGISHHRRRAQKGVVDARAALSAGVTYLNRRWDVPEAKFWPPRIADTLSRLGGILNEPLNSMDTAILAKLAKTHMAWVNRLRKFVYTLPLPSDWTTTPSAPSEATPFRDPAARAKATMIRFEMFYGVAAAVLEEVLETIQRDEPDSASRRDAVGRIIRRIEDLERFHGMVVLQVPNDDLAARLSATMIHVRDAARDVVSDLIRQPRFQSSLDWLRRRDKLSESVLAVADVTPMIGRSLVRAPTGAPLPAPQSTATPSPPEESDKTADLLSYTQGDLDNAIREFKANRSRLYADVLDAVQKGRPNAVKNARKAFGRNVIARELRCKASAMVSASPVWRAIAAELGLESPKTTGSRTRVGLARAIEEAASKDPDIGESVGKADLRATIAKLPAKERDDLQAKLDSGEISPDQALTVLKLTQEQRREQRQDHARDSL